MKDGSLPVYENTSTYAQFRESYRHIFSVAVVATVFVVPMDNALMVFLKSVLGFSAIFAALYLILSAARVKYDEPARLYQVFRPSERFRMRMFDLSVDFFGFAFLLFIGLLIAGMIDSIPGVELGVVWTWIVVIAVMIFFIGTLLIFEYRSRSRMSTKGRIPEI